MFYIGVDLGQRQDNTAIAVVERPEEDSRRVYNALAPLPSRLWVRKVERVALGTPYPLVVGRIREIVRGLAARCAVVVDGTGVGGPVVDMLRAAELGCELTAVTITGGERETGTGWRVGVPKTDLIASVQLALEKGELRIARRMDGVGSLVRELIDTRVTGHHDDLVIALALACWKARRAWSFYGPGRSPWL